LALPKPSTHSHIQSFDKEVKVKTLFSTMDLYSPESIFTTDEERAMAPYLQERERQDNLKIKAEEALKGSTHIAVTTKANENFKGFVKSVTDILEETIVHFQNCIVEGEPYAVSRSYYIKDILDIQEAATIGLRL
jgi:hypothetical protein